MSQEKHFKKYVLEVFMILALGSLVLFMKGGITGFSVYSDPIGITVSEDMNYTWNPSSQGNLNSLALTGSFLGDSFSAYLFDKLVYGYGLESNIPASTISSGSGEISLDFRYGNTPGYDNNNDGITSLDNVIDFNVEAIFDFDAYEDKVCTKYTVENIDDNSEEYLCFGSSDCCSFLNLESSGLWNDILYLNKGKYNAGSENKVRAQLIYYDVNFTEFKTDIFNSDILELDANFADAIDFTDACVATCSLTGYNSSSYNLRFVVDGNLNVDRIDYEVGENVNDTNIVVLNESGFEIQGGMCYVFGCEGFSPRNIEPDFGTDASTYCWWATPGWASYDVCQQGYDWNFKGPEPYSCSRCTSDGSYCQQIDETIGWTPICYLCDCRMYLSGLGPSNCGNEICDSGENNLYCPSDCAPMCGNGFLEFGELCDDGNSNNEDYCKNDCTNNICGDAVIYSGVEQCDDGNTDICDSCLNNCTPYSIGCGNLCVDTGEGETCDDGNFVDGDRCSSTCILEPLFAGGDGTIGNPYQIATWTHLNNTKLNLSASYILIENLSSSSLLYTGWGSNWIPIGNETVGGEFNGSFNGNYNTISNLTINRPSASYLGLFGYSRGNISNVGILNANITGSSNVGILVGQQEGGAISNSYSSGRVSASYYVGGLVGLSNGVISGSYSLVSLSGTSNIGGLVGRTTGNVSNCYSRSNIASASSSLGGLIGAQMSGAISNSYAAGRLASASYSGGLIGWYSAGTTANSYWDSQVTGYGQGSQGGTAKTTAEMRTQSTYSGWDFTNTWAIDSVKNGGYPYLIWQSEVITCGNNITEFSETCDDGNTVSGDGCSSTCLSELIYSCQTLDRANTKYFLMQNISSSGNCLIVTADGITIEGNGHTLSGNITGSGSTSSVSEYSAHGVTLVNVNVIGNVYSIGANLQNDEDHAAGAGGSITLTNSTVYKIESIGGNHACYPGDSYKYSCNGGNGGAITLTNSSAINVTSNGGYSYWRAAGSGGAITLTDSRAEGIYSSGGSGQFPTSIGTASSVNLLRSNASKIILQGGNGNNRRSGGTGQVSLMDSNINTIVSQGGSGSSYGVISIGAITLTRSNVSSSIYAQAGHTASTESGSAATITFNDVHHIAANISSIGAYGSNYGGNGGNLIFNNATLSLSSSLNLAGGLASVTNGTNGSIYFTNSGFYDSYGEVLFNSASSPVMNFNLVCHIAQNNASVNSSNYPSFDVPSIISLNLTGLNILNPRILKDGLLCSSPQCELLFYNRVTGLASFSVEGWTEYSLEETQNNPPNVTSVTLTTTNPVTNDTDQNLTITTIVSSDDEEDNITYAYNWYKNGNMNSTSLIRDGLISYWPFDNDFYDYNWNNDGSCSSGTSGVCTEFNFDSGVCTSQTGCTWQDYCYGSVNCSAIIDPSTCMNAGCNSATSCYSSGYQNCSYLSEYDCPYAPNCIWDGLTCSGEIDCESINTYYYPWICSMAGCTSGATSCSSSGWESCSYVNWDPYYCTSAVGCSWSYDNCIGIYSNNFCPDHTSGKIRGSYDFDGWNDYISATSAVLPTGNDDYTLSAWIYNIDSSGSGGSSIIGWGNYGISNNANAFRLAANTPDECSSTEGKGLINYWGGEDNDLVTCTNNLTLNEWHHVAASFDGTTRKIYLDGVLIGSDNPSGHDVPNTDNFRIGSTNSVDYFNGSIDEVMVFNRSLSAEEIKMIYEGSRIGGDKLSSDLTTGGDLWKVGVKGADYLAWSDEVNSSNVTIFSETTQQRVLPNATNFSIPLGTTNFSNESNLDCVTNFSLGNNYGLIKFSSSYCINSSGQDYDSNIRLDNGFVSINTSSLDSSFNSSANITMYNVICPAQVYYGNGVYSNSSGILDEKNICTDCTIISCVGGNLTFSVSHFTGYAGIGDANLTIWDQNDTMPYGNQNAYNNTQIKFFANYTNNSVFLTGANCSICFNDTGSCNFMNENSSVSLYDYNRSFSSAGNYTWNVTCNKTGYESLNASDTIIITSGTTPDTTPPIINFTNPTPASGSNTTNRSFVVNVSSSDVSDHYTFIDFDKSLVGWYRLENDINDSSSYGNNGTCSNCPIYNSSGKWNGSYTFDGMNDYISLGSPATLSLTNFTISTWFKLNSNYNFRQWLFSKTDASSPANGKIDFALTNQTPTGKNKLVGQIYDSSYKSIQGTTLLNINQWYHAVFSYDGINFSLYINGALDNSSAYTGTFSGSTSPVRIGAQIAGINYTLNGSIDDVMLFNRSLSYNEIASLYNASANKYLNNFTNLSSGLHTFKAYAVDAAGNKNETEERNVTILEADTSAPNITWIYPTPNQSSIVANPVTLNVSTNDASNKTYSFFNDGLVGWWRLEQGNGTFFADDTGKNNGTCSGNSCPNATSGMFNGSYTFDGSKSINMSNPADGSLDFTSPGMTISSWVYPTSTAGNNPTIVSKTDYVFAGSAGWHGYLLMLSDTAKPGVQVGNGIAPYSACVSANAAPLNAWTHVVAVWNDTGYLKIYQNSVDSGCAGWDYLQPNNVNLSNNYPFYIGKTGSSTYPYPFSGSIDEVLVFNRSLSADEIKALYNSSQYSLQRSLTGLSKNQSFTVKAVDSSGNLNSSTRDFFVNNLPNVASVVLNTTNPLTNDTNQNLTATISTTDADNDNITFAYNWYKNGTRNATSLITNGLVSYWPLNNDTKDYFGGNDGVNKGIVINRTNGKVANGGFFDGTNSYLNISTSSVFNAGPNKEISFSWWMNPKVNNKYVFGKRYNTWGLGYWVFYNTNQQVYIGITNLTGDRAYAITPINSVPLNNWSHLTLVINTTARNSTMYLNGVPVSVSGWTNQDLSNAYMFMIGSTEDQTYKFNGAIDEFLVFNKSLSASEVKQLYEGSRLGGDKLSSDLTSVGDVWKVGVKGADYLAWSDETNSSNVTIIEEALGNISGIFNQTKSYASGIKLIEDNLNGYFMSLVPYNSSSVYWNTTLFIANNATNRNITLQMRTADSYNISDAGLVALWGLNNRTGENSTYFKDELGINNGTCSSTACPILTPNGTVGKAYSFDGNDYITVGIDKSTISSGGITLSAWVKTTNLTFNKVIVAKRFNNGGSDSINYGLISSSANLTFYYSAAPVVSYNTWGTANSVTQLGLEDGNWHHILVSHTFGTSSAIKMYVDGVSKSGSWIAGGTALPYTTSGQILSIGASYFTTWGAFFNGSIDEVRIYNRSLSVDEVQNIYLIGNYHLNWNNWTNEVLVVNNTPQTSNTSGKFMQFKANFYTDELENGPYLTNYDVKPLENPNTPPNITSVILNATSIYNDTLDNLTVYVTANDTNGDNITFAYNWYKNGNLNATTLITNGLISYWSLNNDTKDYFGGNDGASVGPNNATLNTSGGRIGGAYQFDGTNDHINLGTSSNLASTSMSVSLWVYPKKIDSVMEYIIAKQLNTGPTTTEFRLNKLANDQRVQVFFSNTAGWAVGGNVSNNNITIDRWSHITFTRNTTHWALYINGILDMNSSYSGTLYHTDTNPLTIGWGYGDTSGVRYWNGSIDEVMIFNRSLNASEVKMLYEGSRLGGDKLSENLTTIGDVWKVGVTGLDYLSSGSETNSSNVTILARPGFDSCGTLNQPNIVYTLQNDIQINGSTCFDITADNITLNGNGYTIAGNRSAQHGIYSLNTNNITIKNIQIKNFSSSSFYAGIYLDTVTNSELSYINSTFNNGEGIYIIGGYNKRINNILVLNNTVDGILLSNTYNNSIENITALNNSIGFSLYTAANNNTINNLTAFKNRASGVYVYSSKNNSFNNINSTYNGGSGITFPSSESNIVRNAIASYNGLNGISFSSISPSYNTISDIVTNSNSYDGVYINNGYNNTIFNLNSSSNGGYEINTLTGPNSLIYNNSFGQISWTKSNLTTNGNLNFPGRAIIGNNSAYFNPVGLSITNLNSPTNVTLYNVPYDGSYPVILRKILRDNSECQDGCSNITSMSSQNITFTVPHW